MILLSLIVSTLFLCGFTPPLAGGFETWGWSLLPVLLWGAALGALDDPYQQFGFSTCVGFGYGVSVTLLILRQLLPNEHIGLLILKGALVTAFSALAFAFGAAIVTAFIGGPKSQRKWRDGDFRNSGLVFGVLIGLIWNFVVYWHFHGRFTVRAFPWSNGWGTLLEGLYLAVGFHLAFLGVSNNRVKRLYTALAVWWGGATVTSPLNKAAKDGRRELATLLLANGADVNAMGNDDAAALHYAAMSGHRDIAELLLAKGADVNIHARRVPPWRGQTPLHAAADAGYKDISELLLANGADINSKASDGMTPLHKAVTLRRPSVVKLLLARGADVNAKDEDGVTPLHFAVIAKQKELVKLLLSAGADVNAKTNPGITPLSFAETHKRRCLVKLLLASGAGVSVKARERHQG